MIWGRSRGVPFEEVQLLSRKLERSREVAVLVRENSEKPSN
jgi:hypothetical protein